MSLPEHEIEEGVITKERNKTKEPSLYKVLLHNDNYTTMDFVVMILEEVFKKNNAEATSIMLNVHQQGVGVAGIYPRDIAETNVLIVHDLAKQNNHPLRCSIEKE
jgi:ATP-dependent Clp protease adaptor protein ClpS